MFQTTCYEWNFVRWHLEQGKRDASSGDKWRDPRENKSTHSRRKLQETWFPMHGNNPKISFVVSLQKKCWLTTCLEEKTGSFRSHIPIRRKTKHKWKFRRDRALNMLKETKPKSCERSFFLQINQFQIRWKNSCQKLWRKLSLFLETHQTITQSSAFWFCFVSLTGNETENLMVEIVFSNELNVWNGSAVMQVKSLKTKKDHRQKFWRNAKSTFFEKWIEKLVLKDKE